METVADERDAKGDGNAMTAAEVHTVKRAKDLPRVGDILASGQVVFVNGQTLEFGTVPVPKRNCWQKRERWPG